VKETTNDLSTRVNSEGFWHESAGPPRVTVVIPVYRNAATLEDLHARLSAALQALETSYEMVFVDDACPENSWAVLKKLAQRDSHVAALALNQNVGQRRADMVGLAFSRGEHVVMMDADLQDPPEAVPLLLARLQAGPAAVFGGRRGQYQSPMRMLTSRIYRVLRQWVCRVPTDAGMFVAMRREVVDALLGLDVREPYLVTMIGCTGLPTESIPVVRSSRKTGRSAYSSWMRLKTGCSALLWGLQWRLRLRLRTAGSRDRQPIIRDRLGSRFTTPSQTSSLFAGVKS